MPSTIDLSDLTPHLVQDGGTIALARSFSIFKFGKAGSINPMATADQSIAEGDVCVAFVFMEDASFQVDLEPAGWNVLDTANDGGKLSCKVLWKAISGQDVFNATTVADGTAGYSGGGNTLDQAGYVTALLRGVDPTNPFADYAFSAGSSYTGTVLGPAVTPSADGAGFLDFAYVSDDGATFDVVGDTYAFVSSTTGGTDGTRCISFTKGAGTNGEARNAEVTGNQPGDAFMIYSLALNPLSTAATGIHDAEVTMLDSGTAQGGGTVTMPTGTGDTTLLDTKDTVLFAAGWVDSSSVQSTPTDWTDSGVGTIGAGTEKMRSAYKRRTGSEASITALTNHNNAGSVLWMGQVVALRNVDPHTPVAGSSSSGASFSTTITLPSLTTTKNQSAFLVCIGIGDDSGYTVPTAWRPYVIGGGETAQGSDGSMLWLLIPMPTAGTLASLSLGTMTIASNNWNAIGYALNVAPNRKQIATTVAPGALDVDTTVEAIGGAASIVSSVQVGAANVTTVVRRRSAPFRPRRTLVWVRNLRGVQENVIT